jgi:hypothetical protein
MQTPKQDLMLRQAQHEVLSCFDVLSSEPHTANAQGLRPRMRRTIGSKASIGRVS